MDKKVCAYCLENIEGGVYIENPTKKLYFCSMECLSKYKKEKQNQGSDKLITVE